MGSKQALSNGNEVEELTDLIRAFENLNSIKIAIVLYVVERGGKYRLLAGVGSAPVEPLERVLASWGSAQYVYEGGDMVRLQGLCTRLLYGLDFALAAEEFEKTTENNA